MNSPIKQWREEQGMSRRELAGLCGINMSELADIEEGKQGIVGELQDCLTAKGVNVSEMASKQSEYISRTNRGK